MDYSIDRCQLHRLDTTTKLTVGDYLDSILNVVPGSSSVAQESLKNGSLKRVFDKHFKDVEIGTRLNNRIINYTQSVFNKEANVEWFGSNLLGTEMIRFYSSDRDRFFDEVLSIDEDYLQDAIATETDVNMSWIVTSDIFNLAITYLLHRYIPIIGKDQKAYSAAVELVKLLQFKFYSSVYSNFFSKPVDAAAAEGAFAQLTLKFAIKREGSWGALIRDRAEYFISKESIHYKKLKDYNSTPDIIYFISDLNTRTRQTVKDYYAVLDNVRSKGLRINVESSKVELDGEMILKDRTSTFNNSKTAVIEASMTYNSFYKAEYVNVVLEMVPKTSSHAFRELLKYMSTLSFGKERDDVEKIIEDTLIFMFDYVISNRFNYANSFSLLEKMLNLIQAPKSKDPVVLSLRTRIEKIAKKKTHVVHPAALAALRTSTMLYIILLAIIGGKN